MTSSRLAHTAIADDGWGLQVVVHTPSGHVIMPATQVDAGLRMLQTVLPTRELHRLLSPALADLRRHHDLPSTTSTSHDLPRELTSVLLPLVHDAVQEGELSPPDEDVPPQVRHVLTARDARTAAARLTGHLPSRSVVRNLARSILGDRSGSPPDLLPMCLAWVGARLGLVDDQLAAVLDVDPDQPRLFHVLPKDEIRRLIVLLDGLPPKQLTRLLRTALADESAQDDLYVVTDLVEVVRPPDWSRGGPSSPARLLERMNDRWLEVHGDAPLPVPTAPLVLDHPDELTLQWLRTPREVATTGVRLRNCLASRTRSYVATPARVSAVVLDADDRPVAALTLDRRHHRLVDIKGPRNVPLGTDEEAAIREALTRVGLLTTRSGSGRAGTHLTRDNEHGGRALPGLRRHRYSSYCRTNRAP